MPEICPTTSTQEQIESLMAIKKAEVKRAFWKVFGKDRGLSEKGLGTLAKSIVEYKDKISAKNKKIKELETIPGGGGKIVSDLKSEIAVLKANITQGRWQLKDDKAKKPIIEDIEKLLTTRILEVIDSKVYDDMIDPQKIFAVMKAGLEESITDVFTSLSQLDAPTLRSARKHYKGELERFAKLSRNEEQYSTSKSQILHPLQFVKRYDPTGRGYKVVKKGVELAADNYSARARQEETLQTIYNNLWSMVEGSRQSSVRYWFMNTPSWRQGKRDMRDSINNIYKFIIEAGRGTIRDIQPTPMYSIDPNGKRAHTPEFSEDYKEWSKIVNENARKGIGAAVKVQQYNIPGAAIPSFYVAIQKVDKKTGREYYRAYDAPYDAENDRLNVAPSKRNKEFYKEFQQREEASLSGYRRINVETGKWETVPGKMDGGWYRAGRHTTVPARVLWGKGKGTTFNVNTDTDFALDETLNKFDTEVGIKEEVWTALAEIRSMLKSVYQDVKRKNQLFEYELLETLKKMFPQENLQSLAKANITQLVKDKYKFNVQTLDMNLTVRGDKIYTFNTDFEELFNYMPILYTKGQKMRMLVNARADLMKKIDRQNSDLNLAVGPEKTQERSVINKKIKELEEMLDGNIQIYRWVSGMRPEPPALNQVTQIKAAKHRSEISSPLPIIGSIDVKTKDGWKTVKHHEKSSGMRLDEGMLHDYLKQTYRGTTQNDLLLELLKAIHGGMKPEIQDYVIDHVKGAIGRRDIQAGIFGFDYSDKRFRIKEDGALVSAVAVQNKIISSNLLSGAKVSIRNATQRTNYAALTNLTDTMGAMDESMRNSEELEKAAANAGVTDEIATIADVLIGNSKAQNDWFYEGMITKAHVYLLIASSTKNAFIKKAKTDSFWYKISSKLAKMFAGRMDIVTQDAAKHREWALADTWELTTGLIRRGDPNILDKKEREALFKTLHGTYRDRTVDALLKWNFEGGALTRIYARGKLRSILSFSPGEKLMRMESIYIAKEQLIRQGRIGKEWEGKNAYYHPEVIRLSRLLSNNAMFSMSRASSSPAFKGVVGEVLGKFKQYTWNQWGTEYLIMRNWINANHPKDKDTTHSERWESLKRTFTPGSGVIKGKVEQQVWNFAKFKAVNGLLAAMLAVPQSFAWTPGGGFLRFGLRHTLGYKGFNTFNRGSQSQIIEGMVKILLWTYVVGVDAEEEDEQKVYQEAFRYWLPMLFNVIYDTYQEGDPLKFTQLYSKGFYKTVEMARELMDTE